MSEMEAEAVEWFNTYLQRVLTSTEEHHSIRLGQAYFNVLRDMRPDLANLIRGTFRDPFYSNTAIPYFLKWLFDTITTGDPPVIEDGPPGWDA